MTTRRFRDNDVTTFHRRLIGMFQRVRRTQEARLARGDTAAPRRGQRQTERGRREGEEREREKDRFAYPAANIHANILN